MAYNEKSISGMKLAAIFICWSDWDWMHYSAINMMRLVDGIIVIGSEKSNYGEFCEMPVPERDWTTNGFNIKLYQREPVFSHPMHSETDKRNYGLQIAKDQGYTHFIMCDADELYDPEEFLREKQRFIDNPNLAGLVCASQVYVKEPTLTIGLDTTLVPFIHKITPALKHEFNKHYPFAWEGRNIRIDPTRSLNINSGVEWSHIVMHHFSHIRKDYERKIRNSTARPNIERMNLAHKIVHLKEGDVFDLYPGKPLVRVPNRFAIPGYGDELVKDSIC